MGFNSAFKGLNRFLKDFFPKIMATVLEAKILSLPPRF
jgi:hypothetical protein